MKAFLAVAMTGLSLIAPMNLASAQSYGGRDYGYGDRDYRSRDRDYGSDRDYRGRGRDDDDDRGSRRSRADSAFDEREYLRCNPDVRKAIVNGQMESAIAHYRTFGRREGRRLSC
ncbi:hypothetical protein [Methylobacterium trifolii]|uniref:Lectin-like protein BA14k n=1 Tax=Methylobacterium trifolii TaxID=1003092 RepID=A0ABQ4U556_9HYPH|nr:hypothetical protein [Methylobacterium trifolii]GJE62581.1 hypothetical protein MPOCJGCO_4714 [Methylobacterium trifolii]